VRREAPVSHGNKQVRSKHAARACAQQLLLHRALERNDEVRAAATGHYCCLARNAKRLQRSVASQKPLNSEGEGESSHGSRDASYEFVVCMCCVARVEGL